jgi:hypothetical protein
MLVVPSFSAWSGGALSGTGCIVPQPFAVGGNRSYPEFWAVTGGPWYWGYFTLIVSPEPCVEWAVKTSSRWEAE